ncbi:ComEA family DNA-binding protein [Amycolatopsis cihanbeyliensis]|uniref:Competence protein ComEA n=1 Tax=Amycolatopsis cihanbeyliensis TaxID=1128664 RepID=A0A542CTR9_AMYCI|nr:ComEA family DNA-binding protein [Amycolatopsis cihanbeyliensis]TQI94190.1 competence protein ComEA [Amycolatopsis cihanbeyliensis]
MFDNSLGPADTAPGPHDVRVVDSETRLRELAEEAARAEATADASRATRTGRLAERWVPGSLLSGAGGRRRRFAVVTTLVGVAGVVVLAVLAFGHGPAAEVAPPLPAARENARASPVGQSSPSPDRTPDPPKELVVSVVGKVRSPGLVTVPPGARAAQAVDAAGGAVPEADLGTINLARKLADGEQLYVGVPAPPGMQPNTAAGGAGQQPGRVELNTAGPAQFEELPGVGEVTAQRIVDWRTQHGPFTAVEQLREVEGIGEKRFARLREQVVVR